MPVNVKTEPPDSSHGSQSQPFRSATLQSSTGIHNHHGSLSQPFRSATLQSSTGIHNQGRSLPSMVQQRLPYQPVRNHQQQQPPYRGTNQYRHQLAAAASDSRARLGQTGSPSQIGLKQQQQQSSEKMPPENTENQIDSQSAKGVFGWTTVDGVSVPFLFRDEKKFVSVRMVEMKLLSKYPCSYPEELKERPPLVSHYITANETKLLNEINVDHCEYDYGRRPFTQSDLIVKLTDFEEFYSVVKKNFPEEVLKEMNKRVIPPKLLSRIQGGWLQVNNTVVPYVLRNNTKFIPLPVVKYAAGLLTDVSVEGTKPSEEECAHLSEQCKRAGLNFLFGKTTKLITLDTVASKSKPVITELPMEEPFKYAQYRIMSDDSSNTVSTSMSVPNSVSGSQSNGTNNAGIANPGFGLSPRQPGPSFAQNQMQNYMSTNFTPSAMTRARFPYGHLYWMGQYTGFYPPTNGHPYNISALSAGEQRMPPLYMFPGGPMTSPNYLGDTPYAGPGNMQNSKPSMPNNQGAVDGILPPSRRMTADANINSQLHRTRRASSESTGSGPSRPGSAVRASPSTSISSPNQQAPSAALGVNPVRSPTEHQQQQGPGDRPVAMGESPRVSPPAGPGKQGPGNRPVAMGEPPRVSPPAGHGQQGPGNRPVAMGEPPQVNPPAGHGQQGPGNRPVAMGEPPRVNPPAGHGQQGPGNRPVAMGEPPRVNPPAGHGQQGPGNRPVAMGEPPRVNPPGHKQPSPQAAAVHSRESSPGACTPSSVGLRPVFATQASSVISPNHLQTGVSAASLVKDSPPVLLQSPSITSQNVSSPKSISGTQIPVNSSVPHVSSVNRQVPTDKLPQASNDKQARGDLANKLRTAVSEKEDPDPGKQRLGSNSPSNSSGFQSLAASAPMADTQLAAKNSQTQPGSTTVAQNSPGFIIRPVEFQGRTISCMIEDNDSYALIEAISRVYFPYCTMQEFLYALESVLSVPVRSLTTEEERSFIRFYKLPTSALMCNKIVKLKDFENHLAQLRYMFKPKESNPQKGSTNNTTPVAMATSENTVNMVECVSIPNHLKGGLVDMTRVGSLVANSSGGVASQSVPSKAADKNMLLRTGMKRAASDSLRQSPSKQPAR